MKHVLEHVVKSLVDTPEEVTVTETADHSETHYRISVAKSDLGQVIGKQGRIANALRTIAIAIAQKNRSSTKVKVDVDGGNSADAHD